MAERQALLAGAEEEEEWLTLEEKASNRLATPRLILRWNARKFTCLDQHRVSRFGKANLPYIDKGKAGIDFLFRTLPDR